MDSSEKLLVLQGPIGSDDGALDGTKIAAAASLLTKVIEQISALSQNYAHRPTHFLLVDV